MDNINHPKHYADTCSVECIQAMEIAFGKEAVVNFCKCNAFKYLWRYKNKNGKEDLGKAIFYCDYGLKLLGEDDDAITEFDVFQFSSLKKYVNKHMKNIENKEGT